MVWLLCGVVVVWCGFCVVWLLCGVVFVWCGCCVVWWLCGVVVVWLGSDGYRVVWLKSLLCGWCSSCAEVVSLL